MAVEVQLSREMRLVDVTMIGVGAMIGAGIFVLTGIAAGVAGPALLVVFLLNGVVALLTAMAYAELGSAIHGAGGGYLWIKRSLPDPSGFLSGWMDWFAHAVACSLYALGFGAYFKEVLHFVGAPEIHPPFVSLEIWLAAIACALFAFINFRGASEAGKAGNVVTIGKVAIIGVFIVAGLWAMVNRPDWRGSFTPFISEGWGGIFAAMGLTFIAFEGYEIIAQTSEEVEDPKRNVPRAVFLSLAIVIPIYLLVALVAFGAVEPPAGMSISQYLGEQKEIALVTAADQFFVGGALLILVGGLLSTLSALNATVYSSSRVAFAMARDASLPRAIARVHHKHGTPHYAILFSTLLIIAMAVLLPIEQVAAAASVMFLLLFGGVNIAVIRLRKLHPELDRGYRVPWVPVVPIVAIAAMLFIAVFMFIGYPLAWAAAGGWIVIGTAFYYAYSRRRETAYGERTAWMERIERKEYRVLVAVSSPKTVPALMEAALAIAIKHHGEIVAITIAEVPEGESLMTGRRQVKELEAVLAIAVDYAKERGVEVRPVVKIGRRISHSLLQSAREEECNFLLLGQAHAQSFFERLVSTVVERVLEDAPCQVGVVYGSLNATAIKGIALPVTGSANSRLAVELAPAFAERFSVACRALTVVERAADSAEAKQLESAARANLEAADFGGELQVLRRADIATGMRRSIRRGELVLMGAPSTGPVVPLIGETMPAILAKHGRNPVIVVRDVEHQAAGRFERVFFGRK